MIVNSRRLFLATGIATGVLGGVSYMGCNLTKDPRFARFERLDVMLKEIIEVLRVGRNAREIYDYEHLEKKALDSSKISTALNIDCSASRRNYLLECCRSDFSVNNISICTGFVLADTELIVAGLRAY